MELVRLVCPSCGAPLKLAAGAPLARCPFCDGQVALGGGPRGGAEPEPSTRFIPFTVSQQTFEAAMLAFLAEGDLTPDDILDKAVLEEHRGIFVPFYAFAGSYKGSWSAAAGFDRKEKRWEKQGDKQVERTVTVTDWRPVTGEVADDFAVVGCASRHLPAERVGFAEGAPGRMGSAPMPFDPAQLGSAVLEDFEKSAAEVLEERARPQVEAMAHARASGFIPGDRNKDLKVLVRLDAPRQERLWLPFWLATWRYGDQRFSYVMDGAGGGASTGDRPEDAERKARLDAISGKVKKWGIGWLITGIVGLFLAFIPTILALVVGIPHVIYLNKKAKEEKEAILQASREVRERALARIRDSGAAPRLETQV